MGRSGGGRGMSGGAMNGNGAAAGDAGAKQRGTFAVKTGLAQMLKGGVIMDVVNPEQARIAEEAGAVAVMALERVPADIRKDGGIARMSDPEMIRGIKAAVTIPVMAKARIGHFVEAQILESLGVDYLDESEVLTPADETHHINKHKFNIPFVCGCRDLGEALRRISEGAAMIRTKGGARSGSCSRWTRTSSTCSRRRSGRPLSWSGRRGADDAAGRRRRVRWERHLQVGRPQEARQGHRAGDHPLQRPEGPRRGLRGSRRAHGGHRLQGQELHQLRQPQ